MEEIWNDKTLSVQEKTLIRKFYEEVDRTLTKNGSKANIDTFLVAETAGFSLGELPKEGTMMYALWVAVLTALKNHYKPEDYKYPTFESFLEEYGSVYSNESADEQQKLWHTANWMHTLFTLIPARKNKGLAMQVVPKVVEGWQVKYVTGSGQTRLTANRVHVFEVEGNTKANHRGKIRPKKKSVAYKRVATRPRAAKTTNYLASRKAARAQAIESQRLSSHGSDVHDDVHDGYTDEDCADSADESSINEEVSKTFKLWRQQPVGNIAPLDAVVPDLLRTSSVFDLNSSVLGGPSELQRGYSWTEIPTNTDSQPSFGMPPVNYAPLTLHRLQSCTSGQQIMGSSPVPYGSLPPTGELIPLDSQPSYSLMSPPAIYSSRASAALGAQQSSFAFGGPEAGYAGGLVEPKTIKDMFSGYHITPHF